MSVLHYPIHVADLTSQAKMPLLPPTSHLPLLPPSFVRSAWMMRMTAAAARCRHGVMSVRWSDECQEMAAMSRHSQGSGPFEFQINGKQAPYVVRREEEVSRLD